MAKKLLSERQIRRFAKLAKKRKKEWKENQWQTSMQMQIWKQMLN